MTCARQAGQFVAVLGALAGCDQGRPRTTPPAPTGGAAIVPRDAALVPRDAAPADAVVSDAVPAPSTVQLPAKPAFGCIGWSPGAKAAACITGHSHSNEPSMFTLEFLQLGDAPPEPIELRTTDWDEAFVPADVTSANQALALLGVEPLTGTPDVIGEPGTHPIGTTAKLTWTSKLTNRGGDNIAPTHKHDVTARCARKSFRLLSSESEGVDPSLTVRRIEGHAIIEMTLSTGREGEYGEDVAVLLLDLATCEMAQSAN